VDDLAGGACCEEAERVMKDLVPYTGVMNLEGLRRPLLAVQVASCCISILQYPTVQCKLMVMKLHSAVR
jgi:hypothetical protein